MPKISRSKPRSRSPNSLKRSTYAFGPEYRIKRRAEFLRIQDQGQKIRSHHFLVCIAKPRQPEGHHSETQAAPLPRIGITVTTKVHKRAVKRNRVKRHVREVFRRLKSYILEPRDVVVIALQGSVDLDYLQVKRELNFALRKAGLLSRNSESAVAAHSGVGNSGTGNS